MAIKVNGTTVIDDSRNLSNVGGLKTVGGSSILGSGDISVGGGTPDLVGGASNVLLPTSGNNIPVGGCVLASTNNSYLASTAGSAYYNLMGIARYGTSYTMNGTSPSSHNFLTLRAKNSDGTYGSEDKYISSGTWQIVAAAHDVNYSSFICVRTS